jgi:hypothetical protein
MSKIIKPRLLCENLKGNDGDSIITPMYESVVALDGKESKKLKLYGTAIVCDRPGINGRSYPSTIIEREMKRYVKKYIKQGRSAAELNHPRLSSDGEGKDYSVFEINLMKVCSIIEDLHMEGNRMMCKMRVVEAHPAGQALKALVDDGFKPGYSLRGAGSVVETGMGHYEVADDYRMITNDVVGNPSFDDDAITDSMYESIKGGKVQVLTEAIDIANAEFLTQLDDAYAIDIMSGRKQLKKAAFESYLGKLQNMRTFG